MGKHGQKKQTTKSIFKVAGSKTFKVKNKPKPLGTQLKKLNEMTKKKTEEVDKQLIELQTEVRNQTKQTKEHKMVVTNESEKVSGNEKIKKFKESEENTAEALKKLNKMEV